MSSITSRSSAVRTGSSIPAVVLIRAGIASPTDAGIVELRFLDMPAACPGNRIKISGNF
jgi:hypothetical protein